VIVTDTTPATRAVQRATSAIPIVMAIVADPVGDGLVASLSQPGGNVTGLSIMLAELSAKRLQLLKEAMPGLTRVVALWNPPTPYHAKAVENLKAGAPSLAIELNFVSVRTPGEIVPAFGAVTRAHAQALYVIDSPPFFTHRATLLRLAANARLAVISGERPYADEGGLMSYGPSYEDQLRRSADYVDKILRGAKPSGLPIEHGSISSGPANRPLERFGMIGLRLPESGSAGRSAPMRWRARESWPATRPGATAGWATLTVERRTTVEAKETVRALLGRLPDDCSVENVLYHLYVLQAIERGQADAAAGRIMPHEEVESAMRRKWLRSVGA
jgi:hypothetical protein